MKQFIRVMKALSDPNRVKILKMLQKRELCVCEIQSGLNISQSTVSKHLKQLEEADLVESAKDGLWVNYCLGNPGANQYANVLLESIKGWLDEDEQVEEIMKILPDLSRESI